MASEEVVLRPRALRPLDHVVRDYQQEHAGRPGVLYLPQGDWQRLHRARTVEADECDLLASLAGVLYQATNGLISDVRLVPDILGPAQILPMTETA